MSEGMVGGGRYMFNAFHLAESFKLKDLEPKLGMPTLSKAASLLVFKYSEESFIFLYRFGSIVFFNIDTELQAGVLDKLKDILGRSDIVVTSDEYALEVQPDSGNSVQFDRVVVNRLSFDRITLIALTMAKSTTLEYFERKVDDLLNQSRGISTMLQEVGRMKRRERQINRFIGYCMSTKQDLVSSLYLLDKPDETWENQTLDILYRDASDMFELRERYRTVDYKLRTIEENLKLFANLLANRKAAFLEWLIIALIAIEVVLFTYDLWFR